MAKRHPVILAGLDVGTSKTAVIIAAYRSGVPKLLGSAISPSVGINKGIISVIGSAVKSIGHALEKAEKIAGVKASSVYISYNGADITLRHCRAARTLNKRVDWRDNNRCGSDPFTFVIEGIPRDEKVLQLITPRLIPNEFGIMPELDARAITAGNRSISDLSESAGLSGLVVKGVIYAPMAGAESILSPAEKELGAILIDFGAGTTTISVFDRGMIRETAVLPVGGEHLSGDLAIGLRTSLAMAEEILAGDPIVDIEKKGISVKPGCFKNNEMQAQDHLARSIIDARIAEIVNLIALSIDKFDYSGSLPGGVVICGGVSRMGGICDLLRTRLKRPVKVGSLTDIEMDLSPAYTNAVGLVKYGSRLITGEKYGVRSQGQNSVLGRFLDYFGPQ